ncbi:hypothetical protein GQX73_g780 [Xylaria multiplex]|uniref:Uncharacterized protein n=1 Tax=Xylaria multiplex TaxID=323545 RepID=A0A7C8IX75_9PEZI|nr:hypothetical protein GQX73_g780 [Xylaria multiplex]
MMIGKIGGSESRDSSHERQSSGSSLDPKASEFESTGPTEQKPKQGQQEYGWQQGRGRAQRRTPPVGPNGYGGTGQGRGGVRRNVYTPPQITPGPQYSQQYQVPPMMPYLFSLPSTGGGEASQPIYHMAQYPQYTSPPMSVTSIPQPTPFYGGQQQYPSFKPLPANHNQGPHFGQNMATPSRPTEQAHVPSSAGSHSSKTGSSYSQSSPRKYGKPEVKEDRISKYRREFDVARSFEDDKQFIPDILACVKTSPQIHPLHRPAAFYTNSDMP